MRTSFKKKILLISCVVIGAAIMILGGSGNQTLFWVGLVIMSGSWLASFRVFRCPHCTAYIGKAYGSVANCPVCGKEID